MCLPCVVFKRVDRSQMSDVYYGGLAGASLLGLVISMFGALGNMIGLTIVGVSNGIALSYACRRKCDKTSTEGTQDGQDLDDGS